MDREFFIAQILIGISFVLHFKMLQILNRNGFKTSIYRSSWANNQNMRLLINQTEDLNLKEKYKQILFLRPVFVIFALLIILSNHIPIKDADACNEEKEFKYKQWNGIVIRKNIDDENNKMIDIVYNNDTIRLQNWVFFENNNFELIEVGDSIVKNSKEVIVRLYKKDVEIILKAEYGCEKYLFK